MKKFNRVYDNDEGIKVEYTTWRDSDNNHYCEIDHDGFKVTGPIDVMDFAVMLQNLSKTIWKESVEFFNSGQHLEMMEECFTDDNSAD